MLRIPCVLAPLLLVAPAHSATLELSSSGSNSIIFGPPGAAQATLSAVCDEQAAAPAWNALNTKVFDWDAPMGNVTIEFINVPTTCVNAHVSTPWYAAKPRQRVVVFAVR